MAISIRIILPFFVSGIMFLPSLAASIPSVSKALDLEVVPREPPSFIVMAIMGGAIMPNLMGHIADRNGMSAAFIVPLAFFIWWPFMGWRGRDSAAAIGRQP